MKEPIDISEPISEICRRLGIEKNNVARITFYPGHVKIKLYSTLPDGTKIAFRTSFGRDWAASRERTIKVKT